MTLQAGCSALYRKALKSAHALPTNKVNVFNLSLEVTLRLDILMKQPLSLPTVPKIAAKLISTFDQDEVDLNDVARSIGTDPVLTAKLLKMANSSFFGLSRAASNVNDAINVLGLVKVRALVIGAILDVCFHSVPGMKLEQFWRYSLNTAVLARSICLPLRIDENTAFTAGLLHGIGELIMHAGMPEAMSELDQHVDPLALRRGEAETAMFGYTFADVGASLARNWKFPKRIVDAIEHQLTPFENGNYEPISGAIHLAAWRCRAEEVSLGGKQLVNTYPDAIGIALGVDPDSLLGDVSIVRLTAEGAADSTEETACAATA